MDTYVLAYILFGAVFSIFLNDLIFFDLAKESLLIWFIFMIIVTLLWPIFFTTLITLFLIYITREIYYAKKIK